MIGLADSPVSGARSRGDHRGPPVGRSGPSALSEAAASGDGGCCPSSEGVESRREGYTPPPWRSIATGWRFSIADSACACSGAPPSAASGSRPGLPTILPVNYVVDGDRLLVRTGPGSKLDEAIRNAVVAFEADVIDEEQRLGWSVVVTGMASEVHPHDGRDADLSLLDRWAPQGNGRVLAISLDVMSGRRLVEGPAGRTPTGRPPRRRPSRRAGPGRRQVRDFRPCRAARGRGTVREPRVAAGKKRAQATPRAGAHPTPV